MRSAAVALAALAAGVVLLAPVVATAQEEDVTPPVLTEITVVPAVFDAGRGETTLRACATAEDDLSGVREIRISSVPEDDGPVRPHFDIAPGTGVPLTFEGCRDFVVPRSRPYTVFHLLTGVSDGAGNRRRYDDRVFFHSVKAEDLCTVGTCRLSNEPLHSALDADEDRVPDTTDP